MAEVGMELAAVAEVEKEVVAAAEVVAVAEVSAAAAAEVEFEVVVNTLVDLFPPLLFGCQGNTHTR